MARPIVRERIPEDWDGFCAAYEAVAAEGMWIGGELPVDWEARRGPWLNAQSSTRYRHLVVDDSGTIVGWLTIGLDDHWRAELGMALVDGYRSMGLGSELLGRAVEWARGAGAHKVVLEVWPHNERALGLYEKHGFVVEGRLRRHWRRKDGSLWDSLTMGLVLDEASPGCPW